MAIHINEEILMADGEKIVREWNYAAVSDKKDSEKSGACKLIVTTKRLIHSISAKGQVAREEIPLKHITSVDTVMSKSRKLWLLAIAAALVIVGVVLTVFRIWQAAIPFYVVSLILIIVSLITKTKFGLCINTDIGGDNRKLFVCTNTVSPNEPFARISASSANVSINTAVVEDIINTIGALLLTD